VPPSSSPTPLGRSFRGRGIPRGFPEEFSANLAGPYVRPDKKSAQRRGRGGEGEGEGEVGQSGGSRWKSDFPWTDIIRRFTNGPSRLLDPGIPGPETGVVTANGRLFDDGSIDRSLPISFRRRADNTITNYGPFKSVSGKTDQSAAHCPCLA